MWIQAFQANKLIVQCSVTKLDSWKMHAIISSHDNAVIAIVWRANQHIQFKHAEGPALIKFFPQ